MTKLINPMRMAEALARGIVSISEKMWLFLIFLLLLFGISEYSAYQASSSGGRPIAEIVLEALLMTAGLLFCWNVCGKQRKHEFITNVICLSVPAILIVNILSICIGIVVYHMADWIYQIPSVDPNAAYYALNYSQLIIFNLLYWLLIAAGLYRMSRMSVESE